MPHCTKCGTVVADGVAFCGNCGAPQSGAVATGAQSAPTATQSQTGLSENVAGALSYALGWITGLIFFFTDKRPYVRFHAAQSIVVFGALHILLIALGMFFGLGFVAGGWTGFSFAWALHSLVWLGSVVLWIVLMIKAYKGEKFEVPIATNVAQSLLGKA
jgi:uncharacterized membrane protein